MLTRLFYSLLFLLFATTLYGQTNVGVISGNVTDSTGKQPIVYATVSVMNVKDTSMITYRITDDKGTFKITNLPLSTEMRVVITAMGFAAYRQEFFLTASMPQQFMPSVKMTASNQQLDEILIKGERPPVMVGKDTTEFNAASFKTLPSAVVEDLLKKMPGVELDDDGNITVNGRPVNKILVDNKEFFGNNQRMATRNLPANLVSKIQVTDDKEQLARNPDINPSELGQILNIRLQKEIKQGLFGKVNGAVGTSDRFSLGGNVNTFRNKVSLSLVGNGNNLGQNDQGINKHTSGGANMNITFDKKTTLSINYNTNTDRLHGLETSFRQQFLGDTTLFSGSDTERSNYSKNHNISAYLKVVIDSTSQFEYRPSLSFRNSTNNTLTLSETYRTIGAEHIQEAVNDGNNQSNTDNSGFSTAHEVSYRKNFKKRGRNLYATVNTSWSDNDNNRWSNVHNTFFLTDREIQTNQLRIQNQNQTEGRMYLNYMEPLVQNLSLRLTQSLSWSKNKDYTDTYALNESLALYDVLLPDLTNGISRGGLRSNTGLGLRYRKDKLMITPGVSLQVLDVSNTIRTDQLQIPQKFQYLLPTLHIRYDRFNFSYNANVTEPSVSDLQPVTNNTNPLNITLGDPNLKPSIAHSMSLNMEKFNIEKQRSYSFNLSGAVRDNAVIRARTVDSDGAQVTRPVNINGLWSLNASGRFNKQWKFSEKWKFSAGTNGWGNYRQGMIILNDKQSINTNWNAGVRGNISFNWMDKIEIEQSYGPNYSENTNADPSIRGAKVWRHNARTGLVIRLPKQFVWDTQYTYGYNPQVAAGMPKATKLWNAGIGYLFMKQDAAQIRISAYDLLNQNFRVNRSVSENFISDSETNVLSRYFMIHFSYNIRNFGAKMPGSGGRGQGGGGRPSGGGPGGPGGRMAPPVVF